jgi:hypothetical protein
MGVRLRTLGLLAGMHKVTPDDSWISEKRAGQGVPVASFEGTTRDGPNCGIIGRMNYATSRGWLTDPSVLAKHWTVRL